ncbi:MAG: hypothetical protein U5R06_04535 [candidate division KSB1 bacterium]|nr:hypothetical protein [candidate division KSB1 bacterium]
MAINTLSNAIIEKIAKHGALEVSVLEKAREKMNASSGERKLEDVLIEDMGFDRHELYQKFCKVYSFREIKLDPGEISEYFMKFIKEFYENLPSKAQTQFLKRKIIPFGYSDKSDDIMLFITPYPLDNVLTDVFLNGGIKKFEIAYSRLEDVEQVLEKAVAAGMKNEFLQVLEDAEEEILDQAEEPKEENIDEEELAAAVNKSVLVNLFEGCLLEAVRQDASDIHIIPDKDNNISIRFRKDGKLKNWITQPGYRPEAFLLSSRTGPKMSTALNGIPPRTDLSSVKSTAPLFVSVCLFCRLCPVLSAASMRVWSFVCSMTAR